MMFLGSFLCGDVMSVPCTPTNIDNINYVEIGNGEFDDLYITKDTSAELIEKPPQNWDFNTILYAKFDGNTLAGNVDWSLDTVSTLLIKRRKADEFQWITLSVKSISAIDDFNIKFKDITGTDSVQYQYAAVPILNGIEGNYSYADVTCKNRFLVIADEDEIWSTIVTDGFCDTVSNVPSSTVVTMNDRYPTVVRNTSANYETVTVTANFVPTTIDEETGCVHFNINNSTNDIYVKYSKQFKEFLNNGKTKLLKNIDGRAWLCYVTTPPTDSADGNYLNRKLTFGVTELGDINNEEDLYDAGLITASEEWWNR